MQGSSEAQTRNLLLLLLVFQRGGVETVFFKNLSVISGEKIGREVKGLGQEFRDWIVSWRKNIIQLKTLLGQ